MKVFFACLISLLVVTGANYFLLQYQIRKDVAVELVAVNDELDRLNDTISNARSDTMRVYHFVSGHKSYSRRATPGELFCPECGLIMDLENRQTTLDERVAKVSERLDTLKNENKTDTQEFKDLVAEIHDIDTELRLLQTHLLSREAMEKKISTITNTPAGDQPPATKKSEAPAAKASDPAPPKSDESDQPKASVEPKAEK